MEPEHQCVALALLRSGRIQSTMEFASISETFADGVSVRGCLHTPDTAPHTGLVLTHGAGANSNAPLLIAVAHGFCNSGVAVLRCDLPFRQLRPHGPPIRGSAERDQQGLRAAVTWLRERVQGRVFLGGHSYGGRQASMLAAAEPGLVQGLILLSYPLHPPKQPDKARTAHLPQLRTPALFVHGSRDGFGTVEEIRDAMKLIPARTELLVIEGAGHQLLTKRNGDSLPANIMSAAQVLLGL